jgi:phage baseplate assembly protein V
MRPLLCVAGDKPVLRTSRATLWPYQSRFGHIMPPAYLERALSPLLRRIRMAVARGILNLVNDASEGHQLLQLTSHGGHPSDNIERLQEYGFFSVPQAGAEPFVAAVGGKLDHLVALCVADHRTRPRNGEEGDAGIYHYEGHEIRLEKDGVIRVTSKKLIFDIEEQTEINSPKTIINGDVNISGSTTISGSANIDGPVTMPGDATIAGIKFSPHTHITAGFPSGGPL